MLGQSSCSSPSTKELHGQSHYTNPCPLVSEATALSIGNPLNMFILANVKLPDLCSQPFFENIYTLYCIQCDQMLKSKVAQNFPNLTQKVPTAVCTKKGCFIEIALKSPNI